MADEYAVIRERIIASLFRRTNEQGILEDTYVGHVKIWEDVPPQITVFAEENGMKPRYLMVSITADGQGHVYKGKKNSNDTFSIGKRWLLNDLRGIEVPDRSSLWLTLGRVYKFRIEREHDTDLTRFVVAAAHLYERLHPGRRLPVTGVNVPPLPALNGRASQYESRSPAVSAAPQEAPRRKGPAQEAAPRPAFRPVSSSSYGSAPGARNTTVSTASTSAAVPTRSRTPVSSSLRESTTNGASRSPKTSVAIPAPPIPDDRVTSNASSIAQSRPRPQSPQRTASIARPSESGSTLAAERPRNDSRPGSHASSSHSTRPTNPPVEPPPISNEYTTTPSGSAKQPEPSTNAVVDRIHAAEPSFALALDDLKSPTEDEYGFEATMTNVEEMIDGFEWSALQVDLETMLSPNPKAGASSKGRSRGAADQIESRLQDELSALEKANIHSFLESDDRVLAVMKLIDDTITVIDDLDGYMSSYKVQLNTVAEDISYIQSRNRGLQVQTQNQNALMHEIEQLLDTVHVDIEKLLYLSQGSPQTDEGIQQLEFAAADLYKAMQAAREKGMAATMERLEEYRAYNSSFTTRLTQFLSVLFSAQAALVGSDEAKPRPGDLPKLPSHANMEAYVSRYGGLVLYTREMDEKAYAKICATYCSVASGLHAKEINPMMTSFLALSKKAADETEDNAGFSPTSGVSRLNTQIRRNNTVTRSPVDRKDKDRSGSGSLLASEALSRALTLVTTQIYREENFIADLLQINESSNNIITFADYMGLESYFRRQAARTLVLGTATRQLQRSALDLIFGFLPETLKVWIDGALAKDSLQLVGIMAALEQFTVDADERGNQFIQRLLQKQSQRLGGLFTRLVDDQIKLVEQTKLTTKKRKGVVSFIKYFPVFVGRLEAQLIGADFLEIRRSVDGAYDRIVQIMFESLQQMAKMSDGQDGGTEDKGILNFHVIMIENMHYFIAEVAQQELGAMQGFLRRAQTIYDDNLGAYVKLVMRRPMGKAMDFFDGIERLLKTTAPTQVSFNSTYSKSALKRTLKEYTSKDMRKNVEALYKRVEKHFSVSSDTPGSAPTTEEGTALQDVWTACQDELVGQTETFSRLISQCYEGSGAALEFTPAEIEQYFRQARRSK